MAIVAILPDLNQSVMILIKSDRHIYFILEKNSRMSTRRLYHVYIRAANALSCVLSKELIWLAC